MNKAIVIFVVVLFVVIGIGVIFYCCNSMSLKLIGNGDCICVLLDFIFWFGVFSSIDWGVYGNVRECYLGMDLDDEVVWNFVDGFFKVIGVELWSNYVKYFVCEIKVYINLILVLLYWEIFNVGYMCC